jgi:outer membrane protein TolC
MYRILRIWGCIALSLTATTLQAQDTLSLQEAISIALQNNFDIRIKKNESALFENNLRFANAAFLPRVNAGTNLILSNNDQKQTFANGNQKERNNIRAENLSSAVNLNWTIFDGMKMFITRDKLSAYQQLGKLSLKQQVIATTSAVLSGYYSISRQQQLETAIKEQIAYHEERVRTAAVKIKQEIGAKPELLQAKIDMNAQKAALMQAASVTIQLKKGLNELLAIPQGTDYVVSDSIPLNTEWQLSEILEQARKNNPLLQLAKQQVAISQLLLKEKKAEKYPVLNFNSAYNFNRNNNKAVVNEFTPLFNRLSGFNYGLSLSIPIFNQFDVKRQIREADLNLQRDQLQADREWNKQQMEIEKAFADYEIQLTLYELELENISMARENVYIAKKRLELGLADYMHYRETLKSLSEANDRLIAARYGIKMSETKLMQLTGSIIQ